MRPRLVAALAICTVISAWTLAAPPASPDAQEITLHSVETDAGPVVEVTVGDTTFRAERLTFLHDKGPETHVYAMDDAVVIRHDRSKLSAREVMFRRGGPLSRGWTK